MDATITILVIFAMVALNALYVAAEFATVGSRRSRVQEAAETGSSTASGLLVILQDPRRLDSYVAACQIGITLSSLVAGAYGQAQLTPLLEPHLGSAGRVIAILIVLAGITAVQVVLGELLPKTIALRYPERLAMATMRPMKISQALFRPLVALFNGSAFRAMHRLGLHVDHTHAHVHSPEELAGLYRASAEGGLIDHSERDMLAGALNVDDRHVREIMTPRRRLVTVPESMPVRDALDLLAGTPHSRFPVLGDDDDVVGMVDLRDLFVQDMRDQGAPVAAVVRPVVAVSEVLSVPGLWRRLSDAEQHCAIVIDEYGSVVGMVTLEDALEEIFGEVRDEFDDEVDPITIDGDRVIVRGDVLLTALDDRFGLRLSSDEVDTLGGLIWAMLGRMPVVGDEVRPDGDRVVIRVDALDGRTVERASVVIVDPSEDE